MSATTALTGDQRRLVVGVVVIGGAFTTVAAGYNYVIGPMLLGLGADESQTSLLRQLPAMAALSVVFLAGVLGDRFGDRRVLTGATLAFTIGSLAVVVAPGFGVAVAGLVVQGAALSAGGVVALAFLAARITEQAGRASAFSMFAIVKPAIYLVVPVLAAAVMTVQGWRYVPLLWTVAGVVALAACRLLPAQTVSRGAPEVLTPVLAGVVLVATVQVVTTAADVGFTAAATVVRAVALGAAVGALIVVYRRESEPSLSLAALRHGGMLVLLVVVLLIPFAALWFYFTMGYQYVFGFSALQTAVAMVPAQVAAIAGALVTRKLLRRLGVRRTGTLLLLSFAGALLLLLVIRPESSLGTVVAVVCVYAATLTGVSIPVTNAIMNTAPAGQEGGASSWRTAASEVGAAVAVVFSMAILVPVVTASLTGRLEVAGLASAQSREVVGDLLAGAASENLAAAYSLPVEQVRAVDADLAAALVDGLHAVGLAGAAVALACTALFTLAVGRRSAPGLPAARRPGRDRV